MKYIRDTLDFSVKEPSAITLGKFDGLHRGHELLMENLLNQSAENGYRSIVFTFDIPPTRKTGKVEAQVLTTNEEKYHIFEETGVDYLIECPFTNKVMCMEPEKFVRWIVSALHVKCMIVGKDFHFGHNRGGDYRLLEKLSRELGYHVIVLEKIQEDGRDISSTFVREEIKKGAIEKANHLLGYEFFVKSKVIHGKQIGRTIGIPTINMTLPPEKILPPNGVYVTRVMIGEQWYQGVSNVGCKPTIAGNNPIGIETYIIDFCQNLYDKIVTIQFLHYIRPEMKFDSIDDLKHQMNCDIAKAENYFSKKE